MLALERRQNYMMFGRELRQPDQLVFGTVGPECVTRAQYAVELEDRLQQAYELLSQQQQNIRVSD